MRCRRRRSAPSSAYLVALATVALAVMVAKGVEPPLAATHSEHVALMLLTALVGIAIRYGLVPSLLAALVNQAALAIERVQLVQAIDRAKRAQEMEDPRSALLNSISHDLGTPLAVIRAATEVLRDAASPPALGANPIAGHERVAGVASHASRQGGPGDCRVVQACG